MGSRYFSPQTMSYLARLARNNNRDWFENHKAEYEETIRSPALNFIADIADDLAVISPHFMAQPKKVGGSLMRVYRDIRFSRDKHPYKTNIGIQFRHERGKDVHAPGFYLHIEPSACFVGVGIWRPDSVSLGHVRAAIVDCEKKWLHAVKDRGFCRHFELSGESLLRAPRGYAQDHPLLEDLKRKDFIAICNLTDEQVLSTSLKNLVVKRFTAADNFMQFLCQALNLQY